MGHTIFGKDDDKKSSLKRASPPSPSPSSPTKKLKKSNHNKISTFHADEDEEDGTQLSAVSGPAFTKKGAVSSSAITEKKKARRAEAERLKTERQKLPIWSGKDAIIKGVKENDTVVILGETGSGKTTQVPQFLLELSPNVRVCCTQPRRVAATSLATRVAAEQGVIVGNRVGYTIRFDDKSDATKTRLKFMTDGTLLAEMLGDRDLMRYDVIVLDEAHERSLRTDLLMGFLKDIQARRKELCKVWKESKKGKEKEGEVEEVEPTELKIVVMSATIDAKRFSEFFDNAPVLYIQGRQFRVKIQYTSEPITDYIMAVAVTFFHIHHKHPPGDVLVFLPGQEDIENVTALINSYLPDSQANFSSKGNVVICPLYAKLPAAEQAKAFALLPPNNRKLILATNVAETSVTIPGVKFVIDTGLAKVKQYIPGAGIDSLVVESISQSSAAQRSGRAGREQAGSCFRLYTEASYLNLEPRTKPEIQRVSLTYAILHLLASGQDDVWKFQYMDRPTKDSISKALQTLFGLDALNDKGTITDFGKKMSLIPLDPPLAKALLSSFNEGCSKEMINLVSLITARDTLLINNSATREEAAAARKKFYHKSGDHLMLLNILKAFEDVSNQSNETSTNAELKIKRQWCKENFVNLKAMMEVYHTRKQLIERCHRLGLDCELSCGDNEEPVLASLIAGLFSNTAIRQADGTYRHSINREQIMIHPGSILHLKKAPGIIYDELVQTSKVYARGVSSVQLSWFRSKTAMFTRTVTMA